MEPIVKSVIESMGVYLPSKRVTTAEIVEGCTNPLRVPLERLTGIHSRHLAGETEFSIDLAIKAVEDCLDRSQAKPSDFDLLLCANISRYDAPRLISYEPSTAMVLKKRFHFDRAIAMDLCNACAGMWTAVYIVNALIRTGAIRHGMIVSGEYISHLTDTAQKEIVDYLDPQLASLTLGDAGVAIAMGLSPRPEIGFHDIELYTLAEYARFCIAKPTDQAHGGAAMHTDAVKVTAAVIPHAATHAELVLQRNGQQLEQIKHIIPHQTSRLTMQGALKEIAGRYNTDLSRQLINNLAERGNTASTAHFLAMRDSILGDRIRSGDDILFLISGSGQTIGTALYTCDDLPDRMRLNGEYRPGNGRTELAKNRGLPKNWGETLSVPVCIESIAVADPEGTGHPSALDMLKSASLECLQESRFAKEEIDLLLSVGVYRDEFLTEPAIAALLACDLKINDNRQPDDPHKTLAFDLMNGPVGFLNACYLTAELARAGCLQRAMIVASEIENNAHVVPDDLLGLREVATAVILHESEDGETGFDAFSFHHFPEHHDADVVTATWNDRGRLYLSRSRADNLLEIYLDCIEKGVAQFLQEQGLTSEEIRVLLPPQISPEFVRQVGERLGFPAEKVVDVSTDGADLATSSTPVAMQAAMQRNLVAKGDLGLVVNVGAGVQVACATYRF